MSPTESKHKAVVVLGMHRSGTSAMAGVLSMLGVDLGNKLLPPKPDNPKGYWEHAEIYDTHERMLNCLGRVWHSLFPFPDNWWTDASIDQYRRRLIETIRRDFGQSPLWGLKDPRMCRLLPMWHDVFPESACEPHFIITVRNPVEVFQSLARRDGFSQAKCSLLWLLHTLESERETRTYKRVFVKYDELLADWRSTMLRISEYFGLNWPNNLDSVSDEIAKFLEPTLKHHSTRETRFPESAFAEYLESTYQMLLQAAESGSESLGDDFDRLLEGVNKDSAILARDLVNEDLQALHLRLIEAEGWVNDFQSKNEDLAVRLGRAETALSATRAELDSLKNSRSWKLTAPLRLAYDSIFRETAN